MKLFKSSVAGLLRHVAPVFAAIIMISVTLISAPFKSVDYFWGPVIASGGSSPEMEPHPESPPTRPLIYPSYTSLNGQLHPIHPPPSLTSTQPSSILPHFIRHCALVGVTHFFNNPALLHALSNQTTSAPTRSHPQLVRFDILSGPLACHPEAWHTL